MHGLVTMIKAPLTTFFDAIWRNLEIRCDVVRGHHSLYPHFSWQVAEEYDWIKIEEVLKQIAQESKPFWARATGLGLFTGDRQVLYIPLVRNAELTIFHERIWKYVAGLGIGVSRYYTSEYWIPHISLVYKEIKPEILECMIEYLVKKTINLEIWVDNIALLSEVESELGFVKYRFDFQG